MVSSWAILQTIKIQIWPISYANHVASLFFILENPIGDLDTVTSFYASKRHTAVNEQASI